MKIKYSIYQITKKHKKLAFTLAEILITLSIIGVIAVLTIPVLMKNIRNKELETNFDKTYNTLVNTTQLILQHTPFEEWPGTGINNIETAIAKLYLENLRNAIFCSGSNTSAGCKNFKGWHGSSEHIVLADGSYIQFMGAIKNCDFEGYGHGVKRMCLFYIVDTNGAKGPNKSGYDRFTFLLSERENGSKWIVPEGFDETISDICDANEEAKGIGMRCNAGTKALLDKNYFKNLK